MRSLLASRLRSRLRDLRQRLSLTQEEVAEKAGVGYKYYQAVEAGRRPNVGLFTLEKIAKALEVEAYWLLIPDSELLKSEKTPVFKKHRTKKNG